MNEYMVQLKLPYKHIIDHLKFRNSKSSLSSQSLVPHTVLSIIIKPITLQDDDIRKVKD